MQFLRVLYFIFVVHSVVGQSKDLGIILISSILVLLRDVAAHDNIQRWIPSLYNYIKLRTCFASIMLMIIQIRAEQLAKSSLIINRR
jgi:hypothetical protein